MAIYKTFVPSDHVARTTSLNQLIDVIQEDVSGSATRRKYQVFVTGGVGPGITSSLFQTIYDQDFSLQTANPIFDMSVGLFQDGVTVKGGDAYTRYDGVSVTPPGAPGYQKIADGQTGAGKLLFASQSVMMREKVDTYRQFAAYLLGNADHAFYLGQSTYPNNAGNSTTESERIDNALFLSVKRLFARDKIRKETFAMRFYQSASLTGAALEKTVINNNTFFESNALFANSVTGSNVGAGGIAPTSEKGVEIFADVGANSDSRNVVAGSVARIKKASDTTVDVGLLFYDAGIVVLDMKKACWHDQPVYGVIDGMTSATHTHTGSDKISGLGTTNSMPALNGGTIAKGQVVIGDTRMGGNLNATFIPDLLVSASIDNIIDHIASTRFSSGTLTSMAFQNQTGIQSTVYFCRANPGDFNYSTNPTFTDSSGDLNVIEDRTDPTERSFTFITTVGLYSANMDLLAVGKLSRPIEKNDEKDLTVRVRLDF